MTILGHVYCWLCHSMCIISMVRTADRCWCFMGRTVIKYIRIRPCFRILLEYSILPTFFHWICNHVCALGREGKARRRERESEKHNTLTVQWLTYHAQRKSQHNQMCSSSLSNHQHHQITTSARGLTRACCILSSAKCNFATTTWRLPRIFKRILATPLALLIVPEKTTSESQDYTCLSEIVRGYYVLAIIDGEQRVKVCKLFNICVKYYREKFYGT